MGKRVFYIALMFLVFGLLYFFNKSYTENQDKNDYVRIEGSVFGTTYHITTSKGNQVELKNEIESRLKKFDNSLSTFNQNSIISRINRGEEDVRLDGDFIRMFNAAATVYKVSNGAFDITVAPLVNACGFGYKPDRNVSQAERDSIKKNYVGFDRVELLFPKNGYPYIKKENKDIRLDASAIAKGQGVDVVASLLDSLEINDYMVEIGGEVRVNGLNDKGSDWLIGISKPKDDTLSSTYTSLQCATRLHNQSLATSGNYLQFYYKDGKRFSHTVDPRSAAPVEHSLLSASIVAKDCMIADALATACMVVGLDSAMAMISSLPETEGYFIWADENGNYKTSHTANFQEINLDN